MYGTPSPFTLSLVSLNQVQPVVVIGKSKKMKIIIFLIIYFYSGSIFAAQYLNSGILPYGSSAGLVNILAAASL